jgi:hypothetical protein
MRNALLIVCCLLLWESAEGGKIVITSLPDTIYQSQHSGDLWDTAIVQGTKLISTTGGLVITGAGYDPPRNWLIDLGGDTLIFGRGNGDNLRGLRITGGDSRHRPQDIIIRGGYIIHSPTINNDTTKARDNVCMHLSGNRITVRNVNMTAAGYNGKCLTANGYDVEIDGGRYQSAVNYYRSRCQFDAVAVSMDMTFDPVYAADSGFSYNLKVHNAKMNGLPHVGIRVDGGSAEDYGVFKIYACSINVDARNLAYPIYDGTCHSSANPYGIAVQYAGPGSEFCNNVITSGTTYGGGRGMLFEGIAGQSASNVLVYGNYIDVHEGPNVEYDEYHVENHAFRIRNDCQYLHVYDNTIIIAGDASPGTPGYSRAVAAFRYTFEGTSGATRSYCTIENNLFRSKSLTSGVTAYAVCFDAVLIDDPSFVFRRNRIESDNVLVKFGEINEGARGIRLYGDTLKILSPSYSPQTFHVGHLCNNFNCSGNSACDMVYENGASDTNIIISCAARGVREFGLTRNLRIRVVGNNGYPVPGANVWVVNNYGDTVLSGLSPLAGMFGGEVAYWRESDIYGDSLSYNNFKVKAKKGTDSATATFKVSATSGMPTVTLTRTAGDSLVCDTCLFICGDTDGSGYVNSLDITFLIRFLYRGGPAPSDPNAADADNSGVVNLKDATYLVNFLYKGTSAPDC